MATDNIGLDQIRALSEAGDPWEAGVTSFLVAYVRGTEAIPRRYATTR